MTVRVNNPGGGASALIVNYEGTLVGTATELNFTGPTGVSLSIAAGIVTILVDDVGLDLCTAKGWLLP